MVRVLPLRLTVISAVLPELAANVTAGIFEIVVKIKLLSARLVPTLVNGTALHAPAILLWTVVLLDKPVNEVKSKGDNAAMVLATVIPLPSTVPKAQKPPF